MIEEMLWKILTFIVAVILMFVAPVISIYDRQESITYSMVFSAVGELTDITREVGAINELNFSKLLATLSATGNTYDVQLEHYRKVYVPKYDNAGNFMNDYYISYEGSFNEDILSGLEASGKYPLDVGDLFFVQVENRSKTKSQVVKDIVFGAKSAYPSIVVRNGGMVRHESH